MLDRVFSYIAPHSCCSCGDLGAIICDSCKNDIAHERFERCIGCLVPAPESLCQQCRQSFGIDSALCLGERTGALRGLLDAYKFRSSKEVARHIVDLLDSCAPYYTETTVTQAPTAPQHQRVRGFDHVNLFARDFAARRSLPYQQLLQQTSRDTQHFKTKKERLKAAGASIASRKKAPECVVLVDDIMTTGATVKACAQRLREAGARRIDLVIVARQMPK